jgi:hypothetical protein
MLGPFSGEGMRKVNEQASPGCFECSKRIGRHRYGFCPDCCPCIPLDLLGLYAQHSERPKRRRHCYLVLPIFIASHSYGWSAYQRGGRFPYIFGLLKGTPTGFSLIFSGDFQT